MTDHDRGQLDTSGAEIYESLFVPSLFGRFANPIADARDLAPTDSVVDVACGTGALTRANESTVSDTVLGEMGAFPRPGLPRVVRARRGWTRGWPASRQRL